VNFISLKVSRKGDLGAKSGSGEVSRGGVGHFLAGSGVRKKGLHGKEEKSISNSAHGSIHWGGRGRILPETQARVRGRKGDGRGNKTNSRYDSVGR